LIVLGICDIVWLSGTADWTGHEGEIEAVNRRPRQKTDVVRYQRSVHGNNDRLITLVQFPTVDLAGAMSVVDAEMFEQIVW
jgi:hypothetical protein